MKRNRSISRMFAALSIFVLVGCVPGTTAALAPTPGPIVVIVTAIPTEEPTATPTPTDPIDPTETPTPTVRARAAEPATYTPTATPLPNPVAGAIAQPPVGGNYSAQAQLLTEAIRAHLPEFQLVGMGITPESMAALLNSTQFAERIQPLTNEVWGEWVLLSQQKDFNPATESYDLGQYGLSPLRQLLVHLIQGQQGRLTDAQQHALHNIFTRWERPEAWQIDMDGIVGAVNRESFLWP